VYVGQRAAKSSGDPNWNGGGAKQNGNSGAGGGATDFRLLPASEVTVWDGAASLSSRIMVAGGGGGSGDTGGGYSAGAAGGLFGYDSRSTSCTGGTQTGGGIGDNPGGFGYGGPASVQNYGGGGGGGYYGGGGGGYERGRGSGGSSFISGMPGCVAINPASTTEPREQDTNGITAALNYSATLFGASNTWPDGAEILFTSISMVDGEGYEWNTGAKSTTTTGMPDWSKTDGSTITGNTGAGYARITRIQ
jgi:hypothetical protein